MSILRLLALIAFAIIPVGIFILLGILVFTEDISPFKALHKKISKFFDVIAKPVGIAWAIIGISVIVVLILKVLITGRLE